MVNPFIRYRDSPQHGTVHYCLVTASNPSAVIRRDLSCYHPFSVINIDHKCYHPSAVISKYLNCYHFFPVINIDYTCYHPSAVINIDQILRAS